MSKILLISTVVVLMFSPLYLVNQNVQSTSSAEASEQTAKTDETKEVFAGADTQAKEMINKINPGYQPWCNALWEPPSGEIESLLFALQAALGAGIFFYYLGYVRGRKATRAKLEQKNASH